MSKNPRLLAELRTDFSQSTHITEPERAMLAYAAKLTRSREKLGEEDLKAMRESGFSDKAILEINKITGYFAYANRLASGLGVELEEFWQPLPKLGHLLLRKQTFFQSPEQIEQMGQLG